MIKEIIIMLEEAPEGGYKAKVLEPSIFTEAETFAELKAMVKDAVQCHFAPGVKPPLIRLHLLKDEVIAAWSSRGIPAARIWQSSSV